jgi:hypothetical protein
LSSSLMASKAKASASPSRDRTELARPHSKCLHTIVDIRNGRMAHVSRRRLLQRLTEPVSRGTESFR